MAAEACSRVWAGGGRDHGQICHFNSLLSLAFERFTSLYCGTEGVPDMCMIWSAKSTW
jgi:hypothetical protein